MIERRSFLKNVFLGLLGFFSIAIEPVKVFGFTTNQWKGKSIEVKDIIPGNIFMRDEDGFPEVILQCNAPIKGDNMKGDGKILYMLGGVRGNPLAPYTTGGIVTSNDYLLEKYGISPKKIKERYKFGITGYTKEEMVKRLNYDKFRLVGHLKYEWSDKLKSRLHGTKYFEKNPDIDERVI